MMMQMTFYNSIHVTVLFDSWKVETPGWYAGTCIIVLLMAVLNQFLFWLVRVKDMPTIPGLRASKNINRSFAPIEDDDGNVFVRFVRRYKRQLLMATKPILFAIQMTLSYFLMLIAMTFNVGLFVCVIAGSVVGWSLFALRDNIPPPEDCCA